ncbi:MAG: hypothetical protein V8T24_07955 [Roseburia hominis]
MDYIRTAGTGDAFFLGELPLTVLLALGEKKQLREIEAFGQPYVILYYVVSAAAGQLLYEKGFFFVTFVWGVALAAALIKRWRDGGSYQLLKSEFRQFGTGGISLVLALTALLFLMAEWKRLSRGCRMSSAYAACMLVLVGNPFGYNDISTFWMEMSYWKMFFLLLPAVAAAIPVTELAVVTKHVWTGALVCWCVRRSWRLV